MSVGVAGHQSQHIAQECGNVLPKEQSWQQRFQGGMRNFTEYKKIDQLWPEFMYSLIQ